MGFLQGKRALIVGVASSRSIAWGIAQAMHREGAELAFTYQNEKLQSRVENAASECGSQIVLPCDLAAERVVPNYNVMGLAKASLEANVRYMAQSLGPEGIRVNAISAGPIKTLVAAGISDFRK